MINIALQIYRSSTNKTAMPEKSLASQPVLASLLVSPMEYLAPLGLSFAFFHIGVCVCYTTSIYINIHFPLEYTFLIDIIPPTPPSGTCNLCLRGRVGSRQPGDVEL